MWCDDIFTAHNITVHIYWFIISSTHTHERSKYNLRYTLRLPRYVYINIQYRNLYLFGFSWNSIRKNFHWKNNWKFQFNICNTNILPSFYLLNSFIQSLTHSLAHFFHSFHLMLTFALFVCLVCVWVSEWMSVNYVYTYINKYSICGIRGDDLMVAVVMVKSRNIYKYKARFSCTNHTHTFPHIPHVIIDTPRHLTTLPPSKKKLKYVTSSA